MKVATIMIRAMQENTYIFYNEKTLDCAIIDPGGDAERIRKFIEDNELKVNYILLTHGHFDHTMAVTELKRAFSVPVAAHKDEIVVLTDSKINMSKQFSGDAVNAAPDIIVKDDEIIKMGQDEIKVLHTPGHTPGGVCYYSEAAAVVFTGDTLFCESIGRSDFAYGNANHVLHSIKTKLYKLPDEVWAYPGHGPATTIGHERNNNPFVRGEV